MGTPTVSSVNPLWYIIERQYTNSFDIRYKLFNERLACARNLYRKDLFGHYGCVNAIEFTEDGELLVSGGDDRRVLVWSVQESIHSLAAPITLETEHQSNIFCVAFDSTNMKIFSGGNDDRVLIHVMQTGTSVTTLPHEKPVYGLSINPQNDELVATAGDDGRILLFDIRDNPSSETQCLASYKTGFHSVMFNPTNPNLLVTANAEEGIGLWDYRKPGELLIRYECGNGRISGISACFNSNGDRVLALRRRLPPVLYKTESENSICQFYHPQYYNSCTMKTCCFAGDDEQYILSGSDDFNLYMWKIPEDDCEWGESHLVLKGHRSIVNQVRYNKFTNLIASSGVEKMVKLWSTLPIGNWEGSLFEEHVKPTRSVYSHEDYAHLVGQGGERISHDYSDQSTLEDSKMMAFFDSLIQRELEGWESPSDTSSTDDDCNNQNSKKTEIFKNVRNMMVDDSKKHKPNRIVELISERKHYLAKMAQEKSGSTKKRYSKENRHKRKHSSKYHHHHSRKHNGNLEKTTKNKTTNHHEVSTKHSESKLRKYRTRQSLKNLNENSNESRSSYDAPSTSTGITNSNNASVFRVIEQDSDEDLPATNNCEENDHSENEVNNFVNILPTPLNGTHDMYINVLELTNRNGVNGTVVNDVPSTSRQSYTNNNNNNVRLSNGNGILEESCASTSNYCRSRSFHRNTSDKNKVNTTYSRRDTDSDSDYEFDYVTPTKKRRLISSAASDSGCGTGPSSSSRYLSHQECSVNGNFEQSSDDEYRNEQFKKRVKKARVNIRKHIGTESDSN